MMRDNKDNVVIVCSIENFDPMGVHTGDSITVAPAQTLTDKEYQIMRDASIRIIREIGVETGGSNIQFAVNPENGHLSVIEMNPRVSRSSALASKATGFPIAKIAAKLAVGYTLDEIQNDITRETPASFEPTINIFFISVRFGIAYLEVFNQRILRNLALYHTGTWLVLYHRVEGLLQGVSISNCLFSMERFSILFCSQPCLSPFAGRNINRER